MTGRPAHGIILPVFTETQRETIGTVFVIHMQRKRPQRHNATCKGCGRKHSYLETGHVRGVSPEGNRVWEYIVTETVAVAPDATGAIVLPCNGCGRLHKAKSVLGRFVAGKVCNAKCTSSIGHVCECSCGGRNHGAGHG